MTIPLRRRPPAEARRALAAVREQVVAALVPHAPEHTERTPTNAAGSLFMTDLHLDSLERAAHAAAKQAPGRWSTYCVQGWRYAIIAPAHTVANYVEQPLARHVALADPLTVLALVAEVRVHRQHAARSERRPQLTMSSDVLDALCRAQHALNDASRAALALAAGLEHHDGHP